MGEAARKRKRLGEWYGKSVVPGHPDHPATKVAAKAAATPQGEPVTVVSLPDTPVPTVLPVPIVIAEPPRPQALRPRNSRANSFLLMAALMGLMPGIALAPPPPKNRG